MPLSLLFFVPLVAALSSLAVRKNLRVLEAVAAIAGLIECAAALTAISITASAGRLSLPPFLFLDPLSSIVLLTVAIVVCAASFYAIGYFREESAKGYIGFHRVKQFYCLLHVFSLAMYAAVCAANPVLMWISIEATTLSTVFLISLYNKPSAIEAAWKYLLITSLGLLLGFFGTLLFMTGLGNAQQGFADWDALFASASSIDPFIAKIAFIFAFIGYGTKVGLAPMHTWLPDAHSKAPSPVSALLSGALLNVAFLAILRFKMVVDAAIGPDFSQKLLLTFGLLSLGIAAFIIFVQKKYKRLFAYSSIEHMGILAIGFGFGGAASAAALLHMIYHSLAKSILFFTSGTIFVKYGFSKIANVRGFMSVAPMSAGLLFIGFLAITGVPPFGTFVTEFAILSEGIARYVWFDILVIVFLVLIFVGFLRHIASMLFGEPPATVGRGELNMFTVVPVLCVAVLLCVLSVFVPAALHALIVSAAASIQ